MARYVAFLRAVNVGGHGVVSMERLRAIFAGLGFAKVETFIASGNVIFETRAASAPALAAKIERGLEQALGSAVTTFVRTDAEVAAIAAARPFSRAEQARATAFNVGLLLRAAPATIEDALAALRTELDDFRARGSEVYWLCRAKQSESTFSGARFERLVGMPATWRGMRTMERLAAKYPPELARRSPKGAA